MTLHDKRDTLIDYLKLKTEEADWHGVADAACDLRELEVEIRLGTFATTSISVTPHLHDFHTAQWDSDLQCDLYRCGCGIYSARRGSVWVGAEYKTSPLIVGA